MADRSFSGGGDGGGSKSKRQKGPGRGPGVAQLEKLLRLDGHHSFTQTPATSPMVLGPHGFWAHSQYPPPQSLIPMTNPQCLHIFQSSPPSAGQIHVERPSNQRFSAFHPHHGNLMVNEKWLDFRSDITSSTRVPISNHQPQNLYRNTNIMKTNSRECGSNFHENMKSEPSEGLYIGHTVPFYNFVQPKECWEDSDHENGEAEGIDLDLDLDLDLKL